MDGLHCAAPFLLPPPLFSGDERLQLHSDTLGALSIMLSLHLILIALPLVHALATLRKRPEHDNHDQSNNVPMAVPVQAWSHPPDHPVYELFRRGDSDVNYAPVGSPGKPF
jgi:hypothetical protein